MQAVALAYSGVDPAEPVHKQSAFNEQGTSTQIKCPSVTTTIANCLLLACGVEVTAIKTKSPPAGMTLRIDNENGAGGGTYAMHFADVVQAEAKASGEKAFTLETSTPACFGKLLALKPASEAGQPAMVV